MNENQTELTLSETQTELTLNENQTELALEENPTEETLVESKKELTKQQVDQEIRSAKFKKIRRKLHLLWRKDRSRVREETRSERFFARRVWPILVPFFFVMGFLVILPLVVMVVYSFVQSRNDPLQFEATFANFLMLFTNSGVLLALLYSILFALIAAVLAVVIGFPIAYIMSNLKSKILAKNTWVLITMPMWISMLLKVLGLQSLFYLMSPTLIGTPIAVIIGMVYMFLPFAITPIYESVSSRNVVLEEVSKDLGASETKTFWKITVRESMPGILTGFSLVLINSATSLVAVHYLGAGKITLITSIIESYFFRGSDFGYGSAIAVVLTILVFAVMMVIRAISAKFEKKGKKPRWKNSSKVPTLQ